MTRLIDADALLKQVCSKNFVGDSIAAKLIKDAPTVEQDSEPVAEVVEEKLADWMPPKALVKWHKTEFDVGTKFYTSPPKHEWVGLSDDEIQNTFQQVARPFGIDAKTFSKAIEAKLKELNHD